jgi:hypothetical protein
MLPPSAVCSVPDAPSRRRPCRARSKQLTDGTPSVSRSGGTRTWCRSSINPKQPDICVKYTRVDSIRLEIRLPRLLVARPVPCVLAWARPTLRPASFFDTEEGSDPCLFAFGVIRPTTDQPKRNQRNDCGCRLRRTRPTRPTYLETFHDKNGDTHIGRYIGGWMGENGEDTHTLKPCGQG